MTITSQYTRLHEAFRHAAEGEEIIPFEVRLLVAVNDHGRPMRTDELEEVLAREGSAIRRAVCRLYETGHLTGRASDGGIGRRGMRSVVTITERGRATVATVLDTLAQQAQRDAHDLFRA